MSESSASSASSGSSEQNAAGGAGPSKRRSHWLALDGLRGLAAVIVVLRHGVGAFPTTPESTAALMRSPLVLFQNAMGAVQLFFVLSGFVLAASLDRSSSWRVLPQYFVRRVFRIHPPYVFAVVAAWCASFFYVVLEAEQANPLLHFLSKVHLAPAELLRSFLFPGRAGFQLSVGWSLEVEMVFSLLLPLMLWVARKHWLFLFALSGLSLSYAGEYYRVLWYAVDFSFGITLYLERERLGALFARFGSLASLSFAAVAVFVWHSPLIFGWGNGWRGDERTILIMSLGAALLVAAAAFLPRVARLLSVRPMLYLGRVSYSLYLLHYPIVILLAPYWVSAEAGWLERVVLPLLVLAVSLPLADASYRWVEVMAIGLGNRVVRRVAAYTGEAATGSRLVAELAEEEKRAKS